MKREIRVLTWALTALVIVFLLHNLYNNSSEETIVPDGQEYRPSGASEGYPSVEFMKRPTEDQIVFEGAQNYLYGVDIDDLQEDSDAHEVAIHIGTGWDCPIEIVDKDGDLGCMEVTEDGYVMWQKYPPERLNPNPWEEK